MVEPLGLTQSPPPAVSGRQQGWGWSPPAPGGLGFFLAPQKNGVANTAASNGKPPRDLGFQDTGKQGVGVGLRMGEVGKGQQQGPINWDPGGPAPSCIQSHELGFLPLGPDGHVTPELNVFKAVIGLFVTGGVW